MTCPTIHQTINDEENAMYMNESAAKLIEQPRRMKKVDRSTIARRTDGRLITAAETAALLEVTEEVLWRWRVWGRGPQPMLRPEGRLYDAEKIEGLAAMPRYHRMLAIGRERS